jgi:hypothetical protein
MGSGALSDRKTGVSCHSRAGGSLTLIHKYSDIRPHLIRAAILQTHDKATWARIAEECVVLIVLKTTKQDFSKHMTVTSGRRPSRYRSVLTVLAATGLLQPACFIVVADFC